MSSHSQSLELSLPQGPLALVVVLDVELAGVLLLLVDVELAEDVVVPPPSVRARPAACRLLSRVSLGPTPGLSSWICLLTSETSSVLISRSGMMDEAG